MIRRTFVLSVAVVTAVAAAACAQEGPKPNPENELHVLAASSLTEAFTDLGASFEADHPGAHVTFNFAASSALAQQIEQGAPADVFASADDATMQRVIGRGDVGDATVIARNRLAILVEPGNPKSISGLAGLAEPGVVVVLCAAEVPCGRYAAAALAKAGVTLQPASLEENVKGVVAKVTLGEADAGIVYATDVRAAGTKAEGVQIDGADDPALEAVYPMATSTSATNTALANDWRALVLGDVGRRTLAFHGFLAP